MVTGEGVPVVPIVIGSGRRLEVVLGKMISLLGAGNYHLGGV